VGIYKDDSGGGDRGLLIGGTPALVEVDISTSGTGSGNVSSSPTGIDCGSTCSASFDAGSSLTLTATPAAGSRFDRWFGGRCLGNGSCEVNTDVSKQTITAKFILLPSCVVPKLKGKTLKAAKHAVSLSTRTARPQAAVHLS
jgi:hypothetical protein